MTTTPHENCLRKNAQIMHPTAIDVPGTKSRKEERQSHLYQRRPPVTLSVCLVPYIKGKQAEVRLKGVKADFDF